MLLTILCTLNMFISAGVLGFMIALLIKERKEGKEFSEYSTKEYIVKVNTNFERALRTNNEVLNLDGLVENK